MSASLPARKRLLLAAAVLVTAAASASATAPAQAALPAPPEGWTQVFADDFTGAANTSPNSTNWQFATGHGYPGGPANWGTNEVQNYTSSTANASLDGNGNLRITPLRDAAGTWTSSRLETRRADFKAPAGGVLRIEGRIQMPNVTGAAAEGYWPAFWALGSPYRGNWWNWPSIGEFDVMENVNGLNTVWGVLHCGTEFGGPCNEKNGLGGSRTCPGTSCQSGFHTYRFEWDRSVTPNALRWYVDGQQYHSVTQNQVGEPHWTNMTNHAGYFLLLNVAMGGDFPSGVLQGKPTPTAATVPGRPMVVDYVAVYTRGGGGGPGNPTGQPLVGYGNKCADVRDGNSANGTAVQLWDCTGGEPQRWTRSGDTLRAYGKCLDIAGGGMSAPGTKVDLWTCHGGQNQVFQARADGSLYNPRTNLCLEVPNHNTTNGTQLIMWTCDGRPKQVWKHG